MTPFPDIPSAAYRPPRTCDQCKVTIPPNDVGFGCKPCFLAGRLTDFCSRTCMLAHQRGSCHQLPEGASER